MEPIEQPDLMTKYLKESCHGNENLEKSHRYLLEKWEEYKNEQWINSIVYGPPESVTFTGPSLGARVRMAGGAIAALFQRQKTTTYTQKSIVPFPQKTTNDGI